MTAPRSDSELPRDVGLRRHRPPRRGARGPVAQALDAWARYVRGVERGSPRRYVAYCPCCDGEDALEARDALEQFAVRGRKRGRRLRAALDDLDRRFMGATLPDPFARSGWRWWRERLVD